MKLFKRERKRVFADANAAIADARQRARTLNVYQVLATLDAERPPSGEEAMRGYVDLSPVFYEELLKRLAEAEARVEVLDKIGYESTKELGALLRALEGIRDELGVPDASYPAPVANAVAIADAALEREQT